MAGAGSTAIDSARAVAQGRRAWLRRAAGTAIAGSMAGALTGCGWWSGPAKPKPPELPATSGTTALKLQWNTSVGRGGVGFAPVFAGDSIWTASRASITRVDAATGRQRWQIESGKPLACGAGSDGELVVVGAKDGTLMAFDAAGKSKWTAAFGSEIVTIPSVALGAVIVRGSDNRVAAYDAETGARRWVFQRQNPTLVLHQTGAIAIGPDTAYAGLPGGRLVALSLQTGAARWESAVASPKGATEIERIADVTGSPLLSGREICAATYQGRLTCFDAPSGRTLWSRDLSVPNGFELDPRMVVAVDERSQIHAFSRTGASLWKQDKFILRDLTAPLSLGDMLLFGDGGGLVHALAREDGAPVARVTTDSSAIVATPIAANKLAVVQTSAGGLYALSLG